MVTRSWKPEATRNIIESYLNDNESFRGGMNINKIEATHDSGAVRFETFCDPMGAESIEFAYYVYRNAEKIHVE